MRSLKNLLSLDLNERQYSEALVLHGKQQLVAPLCCIQSFHPDEWTENLIPKVQP